MMFQFTYSVYPALMPCSSSLTPSPTLSLLIITSHVLSITLINVSSLEGSSPRHCLHQVSFLFFLFLFCTNEQRSSPQKIRKQDKLVILEFWNSLLFVIKEKQSKCNYICFSLLHAVESFISL